MMLKSVFACKPALALAAILTGGSLLSATEALAGYGHHGHWGGGSHFGGGFHHGGFYRGGYRAYPAWRGGYHRPYRYFYHHGFRAYPRYHYAYPRYYYYGYSCYRWRWVATPWGWRLRHINVCYPRYRSYYYY